MNGGESLAADAQGVRATTDSVARQRPAQVSRRLPIASNVATRLSSRGLSRRFRGRTPFNSCSRGQTVG